MNIRITIRSAAPVLLIAFFSTAHAEPSSVVGPVEAVSADGSSITVLGQTYIADKKVFSSESSQPGVARRTIALPDVGSFVAVQGERTSRGVQIAKAIRIVPGQYVPGATDVYVLGAAATYDASLAIAQIGDLRVYVGDVEAEWLSSNLGRSIEIVGRQALPGGVVWASDVRPIDKEVAGAQSITGTGVSAQSITGTGKSTQSITGTGASIQSITGTGVSIQSITGTGKSTQSITGTGKSIQSITGTGASAQSITGTGKSIQSITGTGASIQSITGTGVSIQSITGTGKSTQSITGTGKSIQSITGTGATSQSITGTGR